MSEPDKLKFISMCLHFLTINIESFYYRAQKGRGQTINLVTLKGEEFTFLSPNADTIVKLISQFLDGLRMRTVYAIGLEEFVLQGRATIIIVFVSISNESFVYFRKYHQTQNRMGFNAFFK